MELTSAGIKFSTILNLTIKKWGGIDSNGNIIGSYDELENMLANAIIIELWNSP